MLKRIEEIRNWIVVCEASGIGIPQEIHDLDAYARLLESRVALDAATRAEMARE